MYIVYVVFLYNFYINIRLRVVPHFSSVIVRRVVFSRVGWFSRALAFRSLYYHWGKMGDYISTFYILIYLYFIPLLTLFIYLFVFLLLFLFLQLVWYLNDFTDLITCKCKSEMVLHAIKENFRCAEAFLLPTRRCFLIVFLKYRDKLSTTKKKI